MTLATFTVNGREAAIEEGRNLLDWLRREARLTSVKNGCAEGACGACMVLVDGRAMNACALSGAKIAGKSILTVEGFPPEELAAYERAFAEAGAVQCGFCTPGMVISAKALLDKVPDPTPEEARKAIRRNICRCTGYAKIVQGILGAAALLRERGQAIDAATAEVAQAAAPKAEEAAASAQAAATAQGAAANAAARIGDAMARVDAAEKVSGRALYTDDYAEPGMLYGKALRSPYARARLAALDVSAAAALPGVAAVLTWKDIPGERYIGHLVADWPTLVAVGEETRTIGDAVALVAASDPSIAEKACALIRAGYEELEPLVDPEEALKPGAPALHPGGNLLSSLTLHRGDADAALAKAAHRVARSFSTPFTEHAFMEPESALAYPPDAEGVVTIRTGEQNIFDGRDYAAKTLGIPEERVRILSSYVGGGFGGKEDQSVQHFAALLAWRCGKPVKFTLTRAESLLVHPKRHPMKIDIEIGCDASGRLVGSRGRIVADTGAYASLGSPVLHRAVTHFGGPYDYQDIHVEGYCVYTNNPPAGAFRGFGVPQVNFAFESCLDLLAEKVGISAWEIRMRNAIKPGGCLPNGQIAGPDTALVECLQAVEDEYVAAPERSGLACAFKNTGIGVGNRDIGRCSVFVRPDGIELRSGAACIGQGLATVLTQVACDTLGLPPTMVYYLKPDSALTPDSGTTTASRQTLLAGEACRRACLDLLRAAGGSGADCGVGPSRETQDGAGLAASTAFPFAALTGRLFRGEFSAETDRFDSLKPNPVSHIAYSYACHLVRLGEDARPELILAVHDSGRIVNPLSTSGQVEGGVVMSLGYALSERFPLSRGVPMARYGTLGLLRSTEVPPIRVRFVSTGAAAAGYGAKGIGEISSIPTAAAAANAYHAIDGILRTELPLAGTPYAKPGKA
jgi:CO/xanthine dehydrogenase Mo-binding subunit/aerobic-type carbon monoxide dehydrogenase small subunit (CoxS/CutS family)